MPLGEPAQNLVAGSALGFTAGGGLQTLAGTAEATLPDGTRLYLDRFTLVTLDQLADPQSVDRNTVITIARGRILLAAAVAPGSTLTVVTASGLRAQVLGTVLGLRYDAASDRLEADCLEGNCLLANAADVLQLAAGEGAWVSPHDSGRLGLARYADFAALGAGDPLWITPSPTATPTSTPTNTPRLFILPTATEKPAGAGSVATDTPVETPISAPSDTLVPPVVDTPVPEPPTEATTATPG